MRRLGCAYALAVGLALAACGGQPSASSSPSTPATSTPTSEAQRVAVEPEAPVDLDVEDALSPATIEDTVALSPLAADVVELPSALPERVLDGLGEPIGTAPATLSLPALGIEDAVVVASGLEENGEFEVPGATEVGWYRFGAGIDGGQGSAVLAAHIAYNGRDGVFRNLADTSVGDEIFVSDGRRDVRYRVVSIDQYNKYELPIDDLFDESGDEQLVLITCGGSFNPELQSYDDNVVVVAVPVPR